MYNSFKPEVIGVSLSTPFLTRTRCKHCAGYPVFYYYIRNPTMWYNPRRTTDIFRAITKYFRHMGRLNSFSKENPRFYIKDSNFSYLLYHKGYIPKMHHTRGVDPGKDITEFLMCYCGHTSWAFSNKSILNRPEILNKKARQCFRQKFEF